MARGKSITKELVAQKAIEMARQNGIDSVTYNQLARELGIRPQSMYRYMENIREVRVIILTVFLDELTAALQESMQKKAPEEALYAFSTALYDLCRLKPWCYESLEWMHKYDLLEDLREPLTGLTALVKTQISQLKTQEADRYTQLFMAVTIGYAHMRFVHIFPETLRYDREKYLASMREFIEKLLK